MKKVAGFTLIELLVVIVIIGILATISISGFKGYIEKARLAKAQAAASQMKKIFLASNASTENDVFTSWYSVDNVGDINATTPFVIDRSVGKNHLISFGYPSLPFESHDDTPTEIGKSMRIQNRSIFRHGRQYPQISSVNYPTNKITMATWIKWENVSTGSTSRPVFFNGTGGIGMIFSYENKLGFYIDANKNYYIDNEIQSDKWYYFVGSYNGESQELKIFLDGDLIVDEKNVIQDNVLGSGLFYVGHPGFDGYIDDLMVFPYAITNDQLK